MTYPLEAARKLRAEELEQAQRALADALARETEAEQALDAATATREAHRRETEEAKERETRLESRSVDDLLRGQAWLDRRTVEAARLAEAEAEAAEQLASRRRESEAAREALADARAQKEAVEKHHARWLEERRKKAEKKAEDEADDITSARHGR